MLAFVYTWLLLQVAGLTAIADANRLSKTAADAMAKGRYAAAARDYARMADELGVKDDAVLANLGQAYLRQDDYANATRAYTRLSLSKEAGMRSLAHAQLGVIASRQKNPGEAANQLKEALRQDPNNQLARLNLMRLLQRNPKLDPPQDQKNQDQKNQEQKDKEQQEKEKQDKQDQQDKDKQGQQNQDLQQQGQKDRPEDKPGNKQKQQDKEQADKNGQGSDKKPQGQTQQGQEQSKAGAQGKGQDESDPNGAGNEGKKNKEDIKGQIATREQLKQMQMSEERARQLLDAMRSSEVQYIQQRRHRRQSPSAGSGRPDW